MFQTFSIFRASCYFRVSTCRKLQTCSAKLLFSHSFYNLILIKYGDDRKNCQAILRFVLPSATSSQYCRPCTATSRSVSRWYKPYELVPKNIDCCHFEVHQNYCSGDNIDKTTKIAQIIVERFGSWHRHNMYFLHRTVVADVLKGKYPHMNGSQTPSKS